MHCRNARKELLRDELGLVSAARATALAAHLESCPACATWSARERALTEAIEGQRVELPFPIDVSARVVLGVAGIDPAPADRLTGTQAGWFSAVALAFGTLLLIGLWIVAPDLRLLADTARAMLSGAGHVATGLGAPLLALGGTLVRSLGGSASSLKALYGPLQQLGPVAIATIVLSTTMMAASILLVLGRDMTRQRRTQENEP